MSGGTPNDEKLLHLKKGCRKNNREAQKLLYKEFYGYAMSICIRYLSNKDEVVEVLNDAYRKYLPILENSILPTLSKPGLEEC